MENRSRRKVVSTRVVERAVPSGTSAIGRFDLDQWVRSYVAVVLDLEGYTATPRLSEAS